ncbi:MAG: ABC transporter permease [Mycobacteriales bacterium]
MEVPADVVDVPSPRPTPGPHRQLSWWGKLRRDWGLLAFAVPGIALLVLFRYIPLLGNVIAFQDYQPFLGISGSNWVGVSNFDVIFNGDPEFLNALKNTLILLFIQVVLVFPIPIALALLLNSVYHESFKRIVQSVLYLPHFLSWVIVVALFPQMLGTVGVLNTFLAHHGMGTWHITGSPSWFKTLITSQVIWKDTGWSTILFLAALSRIDWEQYEAAAVDGASRLRQMWHVTLPGLRSLIILLMILRLGSALDVGFEQIVLQPSAGTDATQVLDTYVYYNGIVGGQWGVAAAVGLVKGLVGLALVLGANKLAHMMGEDGVYKS